jgi:hypothetical protein
VDTKGEVEVRNTVSTTVEDVAVMTYRNIDVFDESVMTGEQVLATMTMNQNGPPPTMSLEVARYSNRDPLCQLSLSP